MLGESFLFLLQRLSNSAIQNITLCGSVLNLGLRPNYICIQNVRKLYKILPSFNFKLIDGRIIIASVDDLCNFFVQV